MKERTYSRKLKKSLILYVTIGICLIGITVAFITALPLYNRLKEEQRRHLLHKLEIKKMVVEEYLSRARDTALQVTSRTQIRKKLSAYNRGEVTLEELVEYTRPKLADAMDLSEDMVGITRLDDSGAPVVEVGRPVPSQWWPRPAKSARSAPVGGPLYLKGEIHIVIGANILDRDGGHVGTDIVLFRTLGLKKIVEDRVELGSGGEPMLCYEENNTVRSFFDTAGSGDRAGALSAALAENILSAIQSPEAVTATAAGEDGSDQVYAYAAVGGTSWFLVLKMDRGELFRALNHQILYIGAAIALFLLLGLFGITLLLRPLAGRMLVHTEELERQNEELKTLAAMKDGLLMDVSHELKTPVAKQLMQLEILKPIVEKHHLAPREKKAIQVMEKNLSRQQMLIRNLLDLAQLEAGGRKYGREEVRLDRLLAQVQEDYQYAIEEYGINFRIDVGSVTLISDGKMLWHVFSNLVNNAIKFRRRDIVPSIVLSSSRADNEVRVRVTDNGLGLREEEREKVFSRFHQGTASSEGSGVGLAIVRMIIEKLGGRIWLESPGPGEGTSAVISLPDLANTPPPAP
jgi:signal transduction histidine kinase